MSRAHLFGFTFWIAIAIFLTGTPTPANAAPDTTPPALVSFDYTPKTVDVSTSSQTITVTAHIADPSGVKTPTAIASSDDTEQSAGFGSMTLIDGDTTNGTWQRTITIPTTAAPGPWTVTLYPLSDTIGNSDFFHNHPTKLTVTNGPIASTPAPPAGATAIAGNGQAVVTWTAPANDGGTPITGYTVTASPGGKTATVGGDKTTAVVTGLDNGTSYTFTVIATNAVGDSPASAVSGAVTPTAPTDPGTGTPLPGTTTPTAPAPVETVTPKVKKGKIKLTWQAPEAHGAVITGYTVTVKAKGMKKRIFTVPAGKNKLKLKKLKPGIYKFTIVATNAAGTSVTKKVKVRLR